MNKKNKKKEETKETKGIKGEIIYNFSSYSAPEVIYSYSLNEHSKEEIYNDVKTIFYNEYSVNKEKVKNGKSIYNNFFLINKHRTYD